MPSLLSWGKAVKSPCFLSNITNKNPAYLFDLYQKVQFNSKLLKKSYFHIYINLFSLFWSNIDAW